MASTTTTTTISLTPTAGFCVKSAILSTKTKVFVNIAYDAKVPPPQKPTDDFTTWFVPVVVSDGRKDTDKAGSPCLVFDCVYNTSIKSRILRDTDGEFKIYIIELSLQRIEAQSNDAILLSRHIKTPNILSKGKLDKRTVTIPSSLLANASAPSTSSSLATPPTQKLIEELPSSSSQKPKKSILKNANANSTANLISEIDSPSIGTLPSNADRTNDDGNPIYRPTWSWSVVSPSTENASDSASLHVEKEMIKITILVPSLTYANINQADLSLSATRLLLHVPLLYHLDIDLELSDAEIIFNTSSGDASTGGENVTSISASDLISTPTDAGSDKPMSNTNEEIKRILSLKRHVKSQSQSTQDAKPTSAPRGLYADMARAEWIVKQGLLNVYV